MPEPGGLTEPEMLQLDAAIQDFESRFLGVGPDGCSATAPTGEPYGVFTHDGWQVEGGLNQIHDFTRNISVPGYSLPSTGRAAIETWLSAANKTVSPQKYLYWRTRPQVELIWRRVEIGGLLLSFQCWSVYSRFLMSSLPPK